MKKYSLYIILIFLTVLLWQCQNDSDKTGVKKSADINAKTEPKPTIAMPVPDLDDEADTDQPQAPEEETERETDILGDILDVPTEVEKEINETEDETSIPDDGSWVLLINNEKKISKAEFERSYSQFRRLSPKKVSKKVFAHNIFLANYVLKSEANAHFASPKNQKMLNFIRRQTMIDQYLKTKMSSAKKIRTPSNKVLRAFHAQLVKQPGFKRLSFRKHRRKIIRLYKNQKLNQKVMQLQETVRIFRNDQYEKNMITKYINDKINKAKALGKRYKNFWLYRIASGRILNKKKSVSKKRPAAKKKSSRKSRKSKRLAKKTITTKKKNLKKKPVIKKEPVLAAKPVAKKENSGLKKAISKDIDSIKRKNSHSLPSDQYEIVGTDLTVPKETPKETPQDIAVKETAPQPELESLPENKTQDQAKKAKIVEKPEKKSDSQEPIQVAKKEETPEEETVEEITGPSADEVDKGLFGEDPEKRNRYQYDKVYYVKDIENKINMMRNFNPKVITQFRRNKQFRRQYVERFLLEELAYKELKKTGLMHSTAYRRIADFAVQNFMLGFYMKKVLGLTNKTKTRAYFQNYMSSNQIKFSETYFK